MISATKGPLINITENETISLYCIFQHPVDILEPVSVRWKMDGRKFEETDELRNSTSLDNESGIVITNLTFDPINRFYFATVTDGIYVDMFFERYITCEAWIGNRQAEKATSGVKMKVKCENLLNIDLLGICTFNTLFAVKSSMFNVFYSNITNLR